MRITITKKGSRNKLACLRDDGTSAVADLGPNLPFHDLAHFVVERTFDLTTGFFGHIARGLSPAQLSDKEVIRGLGREPYRAEILARALGSLSTGACNPDQFEALVNAELESLSLSGMHITAEVREAMAAEYRHLLGAYSSLPDGESMTMVFSVR